MTDASKPALAGLSTVWGKQSDGEEMRRQGGINRLHRAAGNVITHGAPLQRAGARCGL